MTSMKAPTPHHWDMVHAGKLYSMQWSDGERLMSLCNDLINKIAVSQPFSFVPLGADELETIYVSAEDPIELLTNDQPDVVSGVRLNPIEIQALRLPTAISGVSVS